MKFWTPDEVATLRRMMADGCTLEDGDLDGALAREQVGP